ncbi:hypothetical protein BJY52DRAFT_577211 [Lactarius psammicola]|nr:hypothetical protein BJY52DRAFT_577211 [Lactarius psammicola]
MSRPSASQLWYGQQPLHVATRLHNGVAPYHLDTNFMNPTGPQSMNYESRSGQSIPRRDYARNQCPGSPFFGRFHPAQISRSQVQSHLNSRCQPTTYPPPGPVRVAPGGNPYGHQKPGVMTAPSPHHGTHRHHPYHSRSYIDLPRTPLRDQNDAGHQRVDLHSRTFHQGPGVPVPSTTDDPGFVFLELLPQSNCQNQTIAPPQDTQINELRR